MIKITNNNKEKTKNIKNNNIAVKKNKNKKCIIYLLEYDIINFKSMQK